MTKDPRPGTVVYEEHDWTADPNVSKRARERAAGPYRAAVTSSIAEATFDVPAETAAAAEDALLEITRFDAGLAGRGLADDPDSVGEFAPLSAVLLRTESASSSQIENLTAGAKALALAVIDENAGANARMVAANVAAMQAAIDLAEDFTHEGVRAVQGRLTEGETHAQPERYRDGQVWIGGRGSSPHSAAFVPPHPSRVQVAMQDLLAFCARTDVPVLIHAALAHAQFETIHPFADGNGRTGRALVHVLLRRAGATTRLTVPVSAGLLVDIEGYFRALTSFREGDATPIVECFTRAASAAVSNARELDAELTQVYSGWTTTIQARRHASVWRLLPHLIAQPAVNIRFVQESLGISEPAAENAVQQLLTAGVLIPARSARRHRVWVAPEVIGALDAFAERAGRRAPG